MNRTLSTHLGLPAVFCHGFFIKGEQKYWDKKVYLPYGGEPKTSNEVEAFIWNWYNPGKISCHRDTEAQR